MGAQRQRADGKLSDKPCNSKNLPEAPILSSISPDEELEAVEWILSDLATRPPARGRRQTTQMVGTYVAYAGRAAWLRGSDRSERIYVCVRIFEARWGNKAACMTVAERLPAMSVRSKRGRPRKNPSEHAEDDLLARAERERGIYNDFKARHPWKGQVPDPIVEKWKSAFQHWSEWREGLAATKILN